MLNEVYMQNIVISNDSNSLQVLKNMEFSLRTKCPKTILVTADYPEEGHGEFTLDLIKDLTTVYGHQIFVLDLNTDSILNSDSYKNMKYQNISELDYLENDNIKFKIYLDELSKHNDYTFIIHQVKRNITSTTLPETKFDAAIIVRTSKSIGLNKSRYITNLIKDADLPVLGLAQYKV